MRSSRLTTLIFIGMLLGIVVGYLCSITWPDPQTAKEISGYISLISDIFLRLIKMIIAPLVFSTLVVGIAHMGDTASVGRVGGKALLWFVGASLCSLLLGLVMVNLLRPGDALNLPLPEAGAGTGLKAASLSLKEFVTHLVPKSAVEAMATNEILQIVVFSVFFGVALAALGERGHALAAGIEGLADVMLKITGYVMMFAPVAVFAAIAATITTQGLGVLVTYGKFMLEFYLSLAVLWCLLVLAGYLLVGSTAIRRLLDLIKEPFVLAFSTASSEAAYPKTLSNLERFGVPNRITSFVLPMGYSFNLDGSMMYCTFAVMFIAQAYNIPLTLGQQLTMLLLLMVTSKGMAGVPRASLVVISATLSTFQIPEAGLLLIIGIDQFLDMGRSATNVLGNSVATVAVAKWEGQLAMTDQRLDRDVSPLPEPAE
ncbi:Proton/sodium-glutamate symport protein [Methylobacterium crusticola]|uniref:Proton/sodium-glutamate symport protein n=1 Tax=Methylobacterium crusticola TaxID=1697972 RepID=A0ABQ4QYQ8_9HYPH|nr:dicarboxylate/amino acid:cation symporter [Methylobacterium crusticola]GJD49855.1 Proton/sodium-glutamate symport protein [Methylobacterium crusticola]